MLMDRNAFDAFLTSVVDVLGGAMGVRAVVDGAPHAEPHPTSPPPTIMVIVDMHGALTGVTWLFPHDLAHEVARQMLAVAEPDPSFDEAAAAELANVLTGRAMQALEGRGFQLELAPPRTSLPPIAPGVCARVRTDRGAIDIVFHVVARSAA